MAEKENKRYFVKDEALRNTDNDMFSYGDMKEVFKKIIDNTEPPYNVAVIGKWGLGKSSLIRLVTEECKKKGEEYLVQEINAWKYERESLRKVFLKQLWQKLSEQKIKSFEIIRKEYERIIYDDFDELNKEPKKKWWERLKIWFCNMIPTFGIMVVIFVITYLAMIVYKCVQFNLDGRILAEYFWTLEFRSKVFLSYCQNVATIWIIPLLVTFGKKALDDYRAKKAKKIELNFPLESVDDYEIFLETKIQEKMKEHKNLKIITVIDDLDRLSIEKIVEALDALKAFVGFERCIFIVPFDDEIIKDALEKRRAADSRDEEKNDIVESELILDKLFQFKLYLPPLLAFDIKEYAINLVKQEASDFLKDFCDEDTMTDLLRQIIIHTDVSTPRQVKKLINAFINNVLLAFEREASGKVQKGLLTSKTGLQQIAKISVLQADFNHFYDTLLVDMSSIDAILEHQASLNTLEDDLPDALKGYFEAVKDNAGNIQYMAVKQEYEPLINFLLGTKKYAVENIAPYLYLAQDDISRKTGDETQRRVLNALKSGNIKTVWTLLEQKTDIAEVICYYLSTPGDDIEKALDVAINVYHLVAEEYKAQLAKYIIIRAMEVETDIFFYALPAENYLAVAKEGKDLQFSERFVDRYLEVLQREKYYAPELFAEGAKSLISHHADLTKEQREMLQDAINMALNSHKTDIKDFLPIVCVDNGELFKTYWGLPWVEKVCAYLNAMGNFEQDVVENLKQSFGLLQDRFLDEMIEYLMPLAEYTEFLPTLNEILEGEMAGKSGGIVKAAVNTQVATKLAEAVISCDFDNAWDEMFRALDGLGYEVTEENAEQFDAFTANFVYDDTMDDVLVYCGQKEAFSLLKNTIASLITEIFKNEKNDKLLCKVQMYLTDEQRESLFAKLKTESENSTNKNDMFERLLRIYEVLAKDEQNAALLDTLFSTSLISKFDANYSKTEYCDFISQAIGYVKKRLEQTTIDKFVDVLIKRYVNEQSRYLKMLNRLPGYVSKERMEKLFPIAFQDVSQNDFEEVFRLIQDNAKSRPTDSESLTTYRNFLVSHIATAQEPNKILQALDDAFSQISRVGELLQNALENEHCDRKRLTELVKKFWNAADSETRIKDAALAVIKAGAEETQLIGDILSGMNNAKAEEILEQVVKEIDENTPVDTLLGLVRIGKGLKTPDAGVPILQRALELALPHQNQLEAVAKLLKEIGDAKEQVALKRDEFAKILAQGFGSTTSEVLKDNIMRTVGSLKLKSQFKKRLQGEDLEYYKKWKS